MEDVGHHANGAVLHRIGLRYRTTPEMKPMSTSRDRANSVLAPFFPSEPFNFHTKTGVTLFL